MINLKIKYYLSFLVPTIITFIIYSTRFAVVPQISDGGELALVTALRTHIHPPGYPLYSLIAEPIYQLLGGNQFTNLTFLSGFLISISCGLMGVFLLKRTSSIVIALLLSISWGILEPTILIATDAEVFGLNQVLVMLMLISSITKFNYWLTPLFFGLAAANHHTVIFYLPIIIEIFLQNLKDSKKTKLFFFCGLIGISPYLLMLYRLWFPPQIQISGYETFSDLYAYLLRKMYGTFSLSNNGTNTLGLYAYLNQSYNYLLLIPLVFPLIYAFTTRKSVKLSYLLVLAGMTWFGSQLLVPANGGSSLEICGRFFHLIFLPFLVLIIPRSKVYASVIFIIASITFFNSTLFPSHNIIGFFEREQILKELPQNSVYLGSSDRLDADLLYQQLINLRRTDLTFISEGLLPCKPYRKFIGKTNNKLTSITTTKNVYDLVQSNQARVFIPAHIKVPPGLIAVPHGATYEVIKLENLYPMSYYYKKLVKYCADWDPRLANTDSHGGYQTILEDFINPLKNLDAVIQDLNQKKSLRKIILLFEKKEIDQAKEQCIHLLEQS